MYVRLALKGPARKLRLPPCLERMMVKAMQSRKFGVGMDFDRTMVNTDEKGRVFPSLEKDPSRVIDAMGGLGMMGVFLGIFSGNKPSYLDTLCVDGYRAWLQERSRIETMSRLSVYAQNATWLQVFNQEGEVVPNVTMKYAKQYLFPKNDIKAIEAAFAAPIQRAMVDRFMAEQPLTIRPAGSQEIHHAYGPIFENRGGVSLSWIAIPGELRERIIAEAADALRPRIRRAYRFEPGGQFSIDINHRRVAKNRGTAHFRRETGLSLLLYFGDSVYRRRKYEGNDLPVVRDSKALVFAVNPNQDDIPQHERIIKAGVGPDATRAWLTWILVKYISVRFATEHLADNEKMRIVDAVTAAGLVEDIEIQ